MDEDALDTRALNLPKEGKELSRADKMQNHTLLDNAAVSIGCGVPKLHPSQLLNASDNKQARRCARRERRPRAAA